MGERHPSRFLMELKAKLASQTQDEMMTRIEAEEAIQDILLELSDSHAFRVVADYRYTTREDEKETDFILQVEDIELRLLVQYSPSGEPSLSRQDLEDLTEMLQRTQGTTALALVWAAPDLPTLMATQGVIELLLAEEDAISAFVRTASPLKQAVLRFIQTQTKEWRLRRTSALAADQMLPETQAILEQRLQEELRSELTRPYRVQGKVAAQKTIGPGDAATMARLLDEGRRASKGADEIAEDLIRLVHRWESGESK